MSGFKIVSSEEALPFRPPVITIYSEPGVGKTTLSSTMPGNTLLIDADEGALRAHKKSRPAQTAKIDKYGDFWAFYISEEFENFVKENAIESMVIDTIGTLLENKVTPWLIAEDPKCGTSLGGLSLSGWGTLGTHFKAFKNRADELGLKLLFLAHGKEEEVRGTKMGRIDVKGGTSQFIMAQSDMLGFMYTKGKKTILDFSKSDFYFTKNTAGINPVAIENAESSKFSGTLERVYDACVDAMQVLSDDQISFTALVKTWRESLQQCQSPTDFDDFVTALGNEQSLLLKKQIKGLLSKRLEEKELRYDKATGKILPV